jgi:protein-L-isoaspartate(D-aspartate) O-methyltransferase
MILRKCRAGRSAAFIFIMLPVSWFSTGKCGQADQDGQAAGNRMVAQQIESRGVSDPRVLAAMRDVPRHEFVLLGDQRHAYEDRPLGIGHGQTISQPYIVALMTELARPRPNDRALEIGTGSGYQAAVLSALVAEVYTIEIVEPLASEAKRRLERLGYRNVTVRTGDGYAGWPEQAPFDIIMVTAAPDHVPPALLDQLRQGGRMVIPVGPVHALQELLLIEKHEKGTHTRRVIPVRFVPLTRDK